MSTFYPLRIVDSFIYLFILLTTILLLIGVNGLITFNIFMTQQTYFFLKE